MQIHIYAPTPEPPSIFRTNTVSFCANKLYNRLLWLRWHIKRQYTRRNLLITVVISCVCNVDKLSGRLMFCNKGFKARFVPKLSLWKGSCSIFLIRCIKYSENSFICVPCAQLSRLLLLAFCILLSSIFVLNLSISFVRTLGQLLFLIHLNVFNW